MAKKNKMTIKKGYTSKNWIQKAIKKPGALRKSAGVKKGQKISMAKLKMMSAQGGKIGKRARLAMTLRKFK